MARLYFIFLLFFFCFAAAAQKKKSKTNHYYYTSDWRTVSTEDSAYYITLVKHPDDSTWQRWFYTFAGPLFAIETYKDEAETIPHGLFAWYDPSGLLDSIGYSFEGKKDGDWFYYNDSLKVVMTEKYDHGILKERKEKESLDKGYLASDSTKAYGDEREAEFKGGKEAWYRYLSTIDFPDRSIALRLKGKVTLQFLIQTDGSIGDVRLLSSLEYALDEAAFRLIQNAPRWEPAFQNGRNVKAYRVQPISVLFE